MIKKFTMEIEMEERWIPHFLSMLEKMENYGYNGMSRKVALYADGDGDFRPKFKPNIKYVPVEPVKDEGGHVLYDAD
jgi:hypothetical protein